MRRREVLKGLIGASSIGLSLSSGVGCGMLLHPERHRAPHDNRVDWKIAALDGLGLLLFFVPGVVAFVVDFYTGAIYLPAKNLSAQNDSDKILLQRQSVARDQLDVESIERHVSDHVGQAVELRDEETRVSKLVHVDEFDQQLQRHEAERGFGESLRDFFSRRNHAVGKAAEPA